MSLRKKILVLKQRKTLTSEEKTLVDRSIRGDHRAQLRLYRKYVRAMYNVAIRMVANKMDAEDIIQDSFVKVFQNLRHFQGDSTLGVWIKRIVINTSLNFIQKNKKINHVDINLNREQKGATLEEVDKAEQVRAIHEAIKRLPEGSRIIFTLYLLEGYQHQEIAQILGISESTSKSQYQRARKLIRKELKEQTKHRDSYG